MHRLTCSHTERHTHSHNPLIYPCMSIYPHTNTFTHKHTYTFSHNHPQTHTRAHIHIPHIETQIYSFTQMHIRHNTHSHKACLHTYSHTMHTQAHSCLLHNAYPHTLLHANTHSWPQSLRLYRYFHTQKHTHTWKHTYTSTSTHTHTGSCTFTRSNSHKHTHTNTPHIHPHAHTLLQTHTHTNAAGAPLFPRSSLFHFVYEAWSLLLCSPLASLGISGWISPFYLPSHRASPGNTNVFPSVYMVLEIKLRSSGLPGRCLCSLNHLPTRTIISFSVWMPWCQLGPGSRHPSSFSSDIFPSGVHLSFFS